MNHVVKITAVNLDKTDLTLKKGDSADLMATVSPTNTTQSKTVTWSSSDDKVATVDSTGKVTAVEGGSVKITAKASNGVTGVCNVTVTVPATKVSLNLTDIDLEKGDSRILTPTAEPIDTTDTVSWATSDNDIVSIDTDGKITAVAPGTATVTATVGTVSASCKVTVGISITQIKLSDRDLTMKKGESHALTATIDPPDTTEDTSITWSSSDDKIATVDQDGNVKAVEGGKAIITAKAGTHTAQCTVTVTVPVNGISLPYDTSVDKGTSMVMTPVFSPENATNKSVKWTSSDKTVATVDTAGRVSALSVGDTTITAMSHDGGYTASCTVHVVISIKRITLSDNKLSLTKGNSKALTVTIDPPDTTEDKTVHWTSSNSDVVTVDNSGNVTAVEGGTAVITAKAGKQTANCSATVTVPLSGITFDTTSLILQKDTSSNLKTIFQPEDATDKGLTWDSSNSDVVTVDETGNLHAVAVGQATITATSHDGGYTASCAVTVVIHVSGIQIDHSSMTLEKGNAATLTATIAPADATDQAVTWTSSNPSVAVVDDSGNVTAVEGGSAVITATTHDGGYAAQCKVTVIVPVTGIALDKSIINLATGTSSTLKVVFHPIDATDTDVTWMSSAPDLISVDQNGIVTANTDTGTATITATSHDGNCTASCTVAISNTPSTPQNVTASISNYTTLLLKWDSPESDGHSPITTYKITLNDKSYTTTKTTYSIDCPDVSMLTVTVCAVNANGEGSVTTKKYQLTKGTRHWTTHGNVTSYEKTGRHWEPKTVYILPDGSSQFVDEHWEDDYAWVTRPCEVKHSGPYYVFTEITG